MSAEELSEYVGAADSQESFVTACWDQATELVAGYVGLTTVPEAILSRATLEVGAELFHRKATKNGVAQFATPDGNPVRIARDPMVAAYPILNRYVGGGFA